MFVTCRLLFLFCNILNSRCQHEHAEQHKLRHAWGKRLLTLYLRVCIHRCDQIFGDFLWDIYISVMYCWFSMSVIPGNFPVASIYFLAQSIQNINFCLILMVDFFSCTKSLRININNNFSGLCFLLIILRYFKL